MSQFHEIIAESWSNAETSALRRFIVDWHVAMKWPVDKTSIAFAVIWASGQFDALEARCEEMVNRS